ncbi:MAG: PIN domain-containing protein [Methanocellales archaeon]|nr:PIN domain-containing protein [Methanocellales archaeon]
MLRAYLDTNVYVRGLLYPDTKSAMVLEEVARGTFTVIQSDYLYDEVIRWFKTNKGKDWAGRARLFMLTVPRGMTVTKPKWSLFLDKCKSYVSDTDDLPHICAYFSTDYDYFVTTNRALTQQKIKKLVKFRSPTEFMEEL